MINIPMAMRGGAAIVALVAALLVQGCTQSSASASIYSGDDYAEALDSAMTSDQGGE